MSKSKAILIIEDEADLQNFISRVLELEGYEVFRAGDGRTGLFLLRGNHVDLVLLDLRLPGTDGWTVLREIRRDPALAPVPVVVLTAIAEAIHRKKTLRMGATKYLVKPLSASDLMQTIAIVLSEQEKLQPAASAATSE